MSSVFLHITKLILRGLPIALNSKDFVDPMLMDHALNWPW